MRYRNFLVTFAATATLAALIALGGCGSKPGANSASQAPAAAKAAPEWNAAIPSLDGSKASLSQYKAKVVLVNFWATWCQPCQAEIPLLLRFEKQYGPKGLVIVGIAMDDEGKKVVEPYVKNRRFNVDGAQETMSYPILLGNDDIGDKFGGQEGLPTSYLYSADGRKLKTIVGSLLVGSNLDNVTKTIEAQLNSPGA